MKSRTPALSSECKTGASGRAETHVGQRGCSGSDTTANESVSNEGGSVEGGDELQTVGSVLGGAGGVEAGVVLACRALCVWPTLRF